MGIYEFFQDVANQVTRYSNIAGQLWYLLTFLFRIFVVVTLGSAVYGDEQGQFKCSVDLVGCTQACYNQFTQISHLRFWGFQLLAVTAPIVAFHFFTTYLNGELEKIKDVKNRLATNDLNEGGFKDTRHRDYEEKKMDKRKRFVGEVKWKRTFHGGKLKEYPINDKIKFAYFIAAVLRIASEASFLYLTYVYYNYPNYLCIATETFNQRRIVSGYFPDPPDLSKCHRNHSVNFIWAQFPETYPCHRQEDLTGVDIACAQHVAYASSIPCWTSRAYEKTVFLRYMNILSVICFLLCCCEMVIIPYKIFSHKSAKGQVHIIYRGYNENVVQEVAPPVNQQLTTLRPQQDQVVTSPVNHPVTTLRSQQDIPYPTTHDSVNYPASKEPYIVDQTKSFQPMYPPLHERDVMVERRMYPALNETNVDVVHRT